MSMLGPERQFGSEAHELFLQMTQVRSSAPPTDGLTTAYDSSSRVADASGFLRHSHTHTWAHKTWAHN